MYEAQKSVGEAETAAWNPDRRTSSVEDALARLDESLAKAHKVSSDLIGRLDIVLQPEEPVDMKDAKVAGMLPTSSLVRRIDEAARSAEEFSRRLSGAMARLDT